MKKQKNRNKTNKDIQAGNKCDLDIPIQQGRKLFGKLRNGKDDFEVKEDCTVRNFSNTVLIMNEKDFDKIPISNSLKGFPDCELKGISVNKDYNSRKKKYDYEGVVVFEPKGSSGKQTAIKKKLYDNIKKAAKIKGCNCDKDSPILFHTTDNTIISPAPTFYYNKERMDINRLFTKEDYIPYEHYEKLKKLSKEELSKKSGLPIGETKDQHVFKIIDKRIECQQSSGFLGSKKPNSKKLNEKSKRKK